VEEEEEVQGEGISLRDFEGNYFGASMQQPEATHVVVDGEFLPEPYY
jgi:hypothetical protein